MRREPFTTLPQAALLDDRLNKMDLRVLLSLATWRQRAHSVVWPTRHEIAARCGIHVSNVSRTTARLEQYGWLKKEGGGGCSRPTTYILCDIQGVVPDDPCTREAVERCADVRAPRRETGVKSALRETHHTPPKNGGDSDAGTVRGFDAVSVERQARNVRDRVSGNGGHSNAGRVRDWVSTHYETENESDNRTEKYARDALPPGVIRADELLTAGASNDDGTQDEGRQDVQEVEQQAMDTPAAAPEAAGAPNDAGMGQPPAQRKKRVQRPEDWAGVHIERPDGVPEQLWADFCALRRQKRATVTASVVDGFRREAKRAGIGLAEAIRIATEHGWSGFRADWAAVRNEAPATAGLASKRRMMWSGFDQQDYTAGIDENGYFE